MFGRADAKAPAADLAYFQANRLDADALAYKRPRPVPPWERPPTPTYEPLDSIFQNRLLNRPQPHTEAARRWLRPADVAPGIALPARPGALPDGDPRGPRRALDQARRPDRVPGPLRGRTGSCWPRNRP